MPLAQPLHSVEKQPVLQDSLIPFVTNTGGRSNFQDL